MSGQSETHPGDWTFSGSESADESPHSKRAQSGMPSQDSKLCYELPALGLPPNNDSAKTSLIPGAVIA